MRILRSFRTVGTNRRLSVNTSFGTSVVGASYTSSFNVTTFTAVGANYASSFGVLNAVGLTYSSSYSLRMAVGRNLFASYWVGDRVIQDTRDFYPFRTADNKRILQYVGRTSPPAAEFTARWNIGGTVSREIISGWNILPQGPGSGDHAGDPFTTIIGSVAASGSLAIDSPFAIAFREFAYGYNVNGAVGNVTFSAAAAIGPVVAAGSIGISSTQLTAGADFTAQYGILNTATAQYTSRFSTIQAVGVNYPSAYNVTLFDVVGVDLVSSYSTVSIVGKDVAAGYDVLTAAGRGYSAAWTILNQDAVGLSFTTSFNITQAVGANYTASWASGGRVTVDFYALYQVGIRPAFDIVVRMPPDDPIPFWNTNDAFLTAVDRGTTATVVRF